MKGRGAGQPAGHADPRPGGLDGGGFPPARAPRDQRYDWAYLFGAVCPARAATAALVLPAADTGANALLVLDGAPGTAPRRWSSPTTSPC